MKINYKNTAIGLLDNPKDFPMHTPDGYEKPLTKAQDLKLMYGIIDQFSENGFANFFNNNIQYITQPFYQAYLKAQSKLKEVVLKTEIDDAGVFIIPWPQHTQTIFYRIKNNGTGDTEGLDAFILMFTKTPKNDSYGLDLSVYLDREGKQLMDVVWKGFTEQGRDMTWWIAEIMLLNTFLKYADVESKVVNAKRKEHHLGEKYVNETGHKVKVLDSTYFTTISRTEGFGVKGHFRFQPYGIGMKERRLQWIADFQKHGYVRKAKLLIQQE